jgi:hypothetical protein
MNRILIDNAYTELRINNGIMHSIFKPDLVINLEIAKTLVNERLKVSDGKDQLLLFDISNLVSVDLEAIQYLSTGEAIKHITAGAIYSSNPIAKFAGKLFIDVNRPKPPTMLFNNKTDAIDWLYRFK